MALYYTTQEATTFAAEEMVQACLGRLFCNRIRI
jgi:hypothetical protein